MQRDFLRAITRRHFFQQSGFGIGGLALSALLDERLLAQVGRRPAGSAVHRTSRRRPSRSFTCSWPARRRSSICSTTSRSCRSTTARRSRRSSFPRANGSRSSRARPGCSARRSSSSSTASPAPSSRSCCPISRSIADDIAIVRSMHTTQFNHAPGQIFMNTGSQVFGRPSMGSWLTYGLGSENNDLPGFVVLLSGENAPDGGKSCWGSGFLPTVHQGVEFRSKGDPVLFVSNPDGVDASARRESLDLVTGLNQLRTGAGGRSGDRYADRVVRDGVSDADQRPRADGHLRRAEPPSMRCTAPSRAKSRSPTTACSRGGWSSAACASCSSITAAGTRTARASATDIADRAARALPGDRSRRRRRWSPI